MLNKLISTICGNYSKLLFSEANLAHTLPIFISKCWDIYIGQSEIITHILEICYEFFIWQWKNDCWYVYLFLTENLWQW
jgi:hypothetical protein